MFAKRFVSIGAWKRFKSTIPKCPEPAIDTGCTFCTPDPALFDKRGLEDPLPPSPLHYKHLILPTGTIENYNSPLVQTIQKTRRKLLDPAFPSLITLSDIGPVGGAILFPDNLVFPKVNTDNVSDLFSEYLSSNPSQVSSNGSPFSPKPFGPLILICGHGSRDARCGQVAPLLVREFETVLRDKGLLFNRESNSGIRVAVTSHIGGHAFAGNIVYYNGKPGTPGLWYGRVLPYHVQGIIEKTILNDTIIEELYRGETAIP